MARGKKSGAFGGGKNHLDGQVVAEADLRAIVRLLGEVAALPGGIYEKKTHLLDGLCDFTGAVEWRWALYSVDPPGSLSCFASVRRRIGEKQPSAPALMGATPGFTTSEHPPPSTPKTIVSRRPVDSCTESHIVLCREPRQKDFSSREAQLASLVLDEIPWLHWREWKKSPPFLPRLTSRQQLTLDLLLLGFGRKEIADQIGISPGTVVGYIRELYRRFGVNSQAELMRARLQQPSLP